MTELAPPPTGVSLEATPFAHVRNGMGVDSTRLFHIMLALFSANRLPIALRNYASIIG